MTDEVQDGIEEPRAVGRPRGEVAAGTASGRADRVRHGGIDHWIIRPVKVVGEPVVIRAPVLSGRLAGTAVTAGVDAETDALRLPTARNRSAGEDHEDVVARKPVGPALLDDRALHLVLDV